MPRNMNLRGNLNSQEAIARNACLQKKDQEGFRVRFINEYIGSGVFCEKSFSKGDFLLEYRGELISGEEGQHRDINYPDSKGSFFYFFKHGGKSKCIDGTASDGRGRMVNDSHKNANCKMKVVLVQDEPRLCLFAIKNLKKGDELRCDYGVKDLPWRKFEEESSTLPSHDPPSDSESCDTPCDVGNRHKRRKKSQNSSAMERGAQNLTNFEVVVKIEPEEEETQDNFDTNGGYSLGCSLPVVPPSSQGGYRSASYMCTYPTDMCDNENVTFIPESEDLQSFIQNHSVDPQEVEASKSGFISVPFLQLESSTNSNMTETGKSYSDVVNGGNGNQAATFSSNTEPDGNKSNYAGSFLRPDPELASEVVVVSKIEPMEDVSTIPHTGNQNGVHQEDPSTMTTSDSTSVAAVDPSSSNEQPGKPKRINQKKPKRKCPFCLKFRGSLTRHIKLVHKDLRRVQEAMMLPEKQRKLAFTLMRKEGILISNMQQMKEANNPVFERERRSQGDNNPLVICSKCKGFYSEMFFARHKCEVAKDGTNHPIPIGSVIGSEDDAASHTHSNDGSCGMCCEEELLPCAIGDDLHDDGEHTLIGSDDVLLHFSEEQVYGSTGDLCSEEEGYTSESSEELCSRDKNSFAHDGDSKMNSKGKHVQVSCDDLNAEEGHVNVGKGLQSKKGCTQAGTDDSHFKEGHDHPCCKDSHCEKVNTEKSRNEDPHSKSGRTYVRNEDSHLKEGLTQIRSDDCHVNLGHSHAGSNDIHRGERHEHDEGYSRNQLQKRLPNLIDKKNQNTDTNTEASRVCTSSEVCDFNKNLGVTDSEAFSPLTQESNQSYDSPLLNMDEKNSKGSGTTPRRKKRPQKCPFCLEFVKGHLRRHIESDHVDLKQVKDAMELPEKEQKIAFSLMRKSGILLAKKERGHQPSQGLKRELRGGRGGSIVVCGGCGDMYPYESFWRHKVQCKQDDSVGAFSGPVSSVTSELQPGLGPLEFKREILDHLPTNEIGYICRSDPTLLLLGKIWRAARLKAGQERKYVTKIVMSEMKTLAVIHRYMKKQQLTHGYESIVPGNVGDMFHERKFLPLCGAINACTRDLESLQKRAKWKLSLFYLFQKACKVIKASHVAQGRYKACMEIDRFLAILEQHRDFVYGGGRSLVTESGNSSNAYVSAFSLKGDVSKLRGHIEKEMNGMLMDTSLVWNENNLKKLREMTVLRLTLLNVRQGGEPCRLTVQDFQNGKWNLSTNNEEVESTVHPIEKELKENWTMVYQSNLGNDRLVPLCVPADCVLAMVILSSKDNRESVGVPASNPYMFADAEREERHVSGWSVLSNICDDAGIQREAKVRTAENYGWVSLLYSSMELPDPDQDLIFNKMEHAYVESHNAGRIPEIEQMTEDSFQSGKGRKEKVPNPDPELEPLQTKEIPRDLQGQQLHSANDEKQNKRVCPFCMKAISGSHLTQHIATIHKNLDEVKHAGQHSKGNRSYSQVLQQEDPEFSKGVLSAIMHSKIGQVCIADKDILSVGRWIWNTKKGSKSSQDTERIRSEVVMAMEHLVVLKMQFEEEVLKCGKKIDRFRTVDMFCANNFNVLKKSILSFTAKMENNEGDGTKQKLLVLIKKAASILLASLLIDENDVKANKIERFLAILKKRKNSIVSETVVCTDRNKQSGNGSLGQQMMEMSLAKTKDQSLKRNELFSKEGDSMSDPSSCFIKMPRVTEDTCTVDKADQAANSGESVIRTETKVLPPRKKLKVNDKDFTTIEDSESEQEVEEQKDDEEFSMGKTKGKEGTGKRHKWSERATHLINKHFKSYICTPGQINRGKLPGKEEVKVFLKKNREVLRDVKLEDRKVLLVRTKVFNERNNYRRSLQASNEER